MHAILKKVRGWAGLASRSNKAPRHRSRFEAETVQKVRDGHIQGWFAEQEGIYLQRLLERIKTMEGAVVELGSYMGLSSCYLGAKCKQLNQKLICIDTFTGSEEHQELLKPYNGSSKELTRQVPREAPQARGVKSENGCYVIYALRSAESMM